MPYVLEFTWRRNQRRHARIVFFRWLLGTLLVAAALYGFWFYEQCKEPTFHDIMNVNNSKAPGTPSYSSMAQKIRRVNAETSRLSELHRGAAEYVRYAWAPDPVTNLLSEIAANLEDDRLSNLQPLRLVLEFTDSSKDWVAADGSAFDFVHGMRLSMTWRLRSFQDAVSGEATRSVVTNLFLASAKNAKPRFVRDSFLEVADEGTEVDLCVTYPSVLPFPVSTSISEMEAKLRAFHGKVADYKFPKDDNGPLSVIFVQAMSRISDAAEKARLEAEFAVAPDPYEWMKAKALDVPPIGIVLNGENNRAFCERWQKAMCATSPRGRKTQNELMAGKDSGYLEAEDLAKFVESLPDETVLRDVCRQYAKKCADLSKALDSASFRAYDPADTPPNTARRTTMDLYSYEASTNKVQVLPLERILPAASACETMFVTHPTLFDHKTFAMPTNGVDMALSNAPRYALADWEYSCAVTNGAPVRLSDLAKGLQTFVRAGGAYEPSHVEIEFAETGLLESVKIRGQLPVKPEKEFRAESSEGK